MRGRDWKWCSHGCLCSANGATAYQPSPTGWVSSQKTAKGCKPGASLLDTVISMRRAYSPDGFRNQNLGRWPRLVCGRAVGARAFLIEVFTVMRERRESFFNTPSAWRRGWFIHAPMRAKRKNALAEIPRGRLKFCWRSPRAPLADVRGSGRILRTGPSPS